MKYNIIIIILSPGKSYLKHFLHNIIQFYFLPLNLLILMQLFF
jgi:hypothetical protein